MNQFPEILDILEAVFELFGENPTRSIVSLYPKTVGDALRAKGFNISDELTWERLCEYNKTVRKVKIKPDGGETVEVWLCEPHISKKKADQADTMPFMFRVGAVANEIATLRRKRTSETNGDGTKALRRAVDKELTGYMQRIGVMIGSPSDAGDERQAITDALLRWNAVNRDKGIIIDPVKWETHATPGLHGRPQGMINAALIPISDILLALFRSRAGSPTGKELSGTIEEIREFMRAGKYVVLYFYEGDVDIRTVDPDQLKTLTAFRKEIQQHGLIAGYSSVSELREHVLCHLTSIVGQLTVPQLADVGEQDATATGKLQVGDISANGDRQHFAQASQSRSVDQKVAEVLNETYRRLFRLYESVSSYVKIIEWSHEASKEEKLEVVGKANQEFWEYSLLNRIYVPPRLYDEIRTMAGRLTDIANGFTHVREREERGLVRDDEEDGWMTAFRSMESEAGPLFKSVVRQIQERLGVRDTEEPDVTSP